MTAQIPAEGPFYRADGSFVGYALAVAVLQVDLVAVQESGPALAQDLTGRVFLQKIQTAGGQVLAEIYGVNGAGGVANRIAFTLTAEASGDLLPVGGPDGRDLVHVIGEVTGAGFDPVFTAPFAIRRVRRAGPATVLQLEPNVGLVLVRYAGGPGLDGGDGWTPVLAVVVDGPRRVYQVADWTGGTGTKPAVGLYVGEAGLVADIADGVAVGGVDGDDGWAPVLAIVADGERRVAQVVDWTGGAGTKPAVDLYVGAAGLVADIADGVDVRGDVGATGDDGWAPVLAIAADGARRVAQVVDWT
ncbi:hypothetical protein, partial [Reyranella sp.]|uniref:hypothetical protein n=1 Tax=Reyranella sp. TaxID=1929291 RepID=UPI002730A860